MKWLCLLFMACRAPEPASQPVALGTKMGALAVRVGRGGITVEELKAKLDALGAGKERYRDPKELRAFVDNQIRFELLVDEAMRRGLDRDPEVQETARRTMVQKLVNQELEAQEPSDADVEKAYQQNLGDYRQPERVQVALYVLKTQAEAEAMVQQLKASADAPVDQRFLSDTELAALYGDEVARAIFAAKELGAVGPIVKTQSGFVAFKVTGRRAAFARPLAEVAPSIKQRLSRQKRNESFEALVTRLKNEVPVTIDDGKLQEVWK